MSDDPTNESTSESISAPMNEELTDDLNDELNEHEQNETLPETLPEEMAGETSGEAGEIEDPVFAPSPDFAADTTSAEARAIEAILMVADQPVTPQLLGELLEIRPGNAEALCEAMAAAIY